MRLLMWDIDQTLLRAGTVTGEAYAAAFTEVTGVPYQSIPTSLAGRTDRHIAAEVFEVHGILDPPVDRLFDAYVTHLTARRHLLPARGEVLDGVPEVLSALHGRSGIVQTLVTGNLRPVAELKLTAFGLLRFVDAEVGGYGSEDLVRATLVRSSRQRAEAAYGVFTDVLVIGDTPHDVAGALACGVTAIGVASGRHTTDELWAAGAHEVFNSLADVDAVVAQLSGISRTKAA